MDNLYRYQVNSDGTATVKEYLGNETDVVVPECLDGFPVTVIGEHAFNGQKQLRRVTLPDSIVEIQHMAFASCRELTQMNRPLKLAKVGGAAFNFCPVSLTPKGNQPMEEQDFKYVLDENGDAEITGCHTYGDEVVFPATLRGHKVTRIGGFQNAQVKSVVICEGITSVTTFGFQGCTHLQQVRFPDSLKQIGGHGFAYCRALTEVRLPDNLIDIMDHAFTCCTSLKKVKLPQKLIFIPRGAFCYCSALTDVEVPKGRVVIEEAAFLDCESLRNITLPTNIKIHPRAFNGCKALTIQQQTPGGQQKVPLLSEDDYYHVIYELREDGAYVTGCSKNSGLVEIYGQWKGLPVKEILPGAFRGKGVERVWIREGVQKIGEAAFAGCIQLYELKIPASVKHIGANAIPNMGQRTIVDPYSHAALQQDPWARKQLGLYDPVEPEYKTVYVTNAIVRSGSYAESWCREHSIPYTVE